jgi:hypothetical protein
MKSNDEVKEPAFSPVLLEKYPGSELMEALSIPTGSVLSPLSQTVIHDALIETLPDDALTEVPVTWESLFEANNYTLPHSHHENSSSNAPADSKINVQQMGTTKINDSNIVLKLYFDSHILSPLLQVKLMVRYLQISSR